MRTALKNVIDAVLGFASGAVILSVSWAVIALPFLVIAPHLTDRPTRPLIFVASLPAAVVEVYFACKFWRDWRWYWSGALVSTVITAAGFIVDPYIR